MLILFRPLLSSDEKIQVKPNFDTPQRKCEEYWPAQGKQRKYGVIYVANVDTHVRADYVIRTFTVRMEGVNTSHAC